MNVNGFERPASLRPRTPPAPVPEPARDQEAAHSGEAERQPIAPHGAVTILTSIHDPFDPRIFHKQARALAEAGYRVTLLAPHPLDETVDGVRVWGVGPPPSRAGRPLVWLRLLVRALRLRADAYHFHDPELLPLGWLLARLTHRPVVYDAHEYYRDEIATRPWIPAPLRRLAAESVHTVESFVARRIAAVVAVNEHMAAGFRARGARSVAVHNYPPLSYFPPKAAGASPPGPVAAYVGLLTKDRGLATVWEAGQRMRDLVPGLEVRIIGRIDWSEAPASVPRDPARWQAEAATRLLGVLPSRDVPAMLGEVAVGWIPFRRTPNNARTIPLKLLEYMAAGLPVVASDFGFMAAIVHQARCGLLVPDSDPAAHARALAHLLTHPEEARAMGERGRRAVEERYSWEAESARLLGLYAELVQGTG
jgi:glycosyltransferase involved in cell wall biosynthesis